MNGLKDKIKEELLEKDLIPTLLERLECTNINNRPTRYEAMLPDRFNSQNRRSVQVNKNDNLTSFVRSRNISGDIFTLVAYLETGEQDESYLNSRLRRTMNRIIEILNLEQLKNGVTNRQQNDPNAWLKKIKSRQNKRIVLSELDYSPPMPESVLDGFVMIPHKKWLDDGIDIETQQFFDVGFDMASERIIFPIRNSTGQIVGIKGRSTKDNDVAKYLFLYPFQKALYLYNHHIAVDYAKQSGKVIVVESEKSVMKLSQMGYKNVVSQMGTEITRVQAELIFHMCPDIKPILVFDKDKKVDDVKREAKVFKSRFDVVYAMYDTDDLLDDYESPADKSKEVWDKMYKDNIYPIQLQ